LLLLVGSLLYRGYNDARSYKYKLLVETELTIPVANKRTFLESNPASERTGNLWDDQRGTEQEIELGYRISDTTGSDKVTELACIIDDRSEFKGF